MKICLENNRLEIINYLKGYSICTIVLMHIIMDNNIWLPGGIKKMASIGGTGVHVFLLCSAVGLYISYLKKRVSFTEFITKRVKKIYVPYIIIVFLSFCVPWMYLASDKIIALLSHVFLFKMFIPRYEESFGAHLWFISTIIQLYLVFIPMCKLKERIRSRKVFFLLFLAISVVWWAIVYHLGYYNERVWNSFCLQYIWEYALGICIADLLYTGQTISINKLLLPVLAIGGIGLQASFTMLSEGLKAFNDIPALIGYLSLALIFHNLKVIRIVADKIASFSYEMYLVHILVIGFVFHFYCPQNMIISLLCGLLIFVLSIIVGKLYHMAIQKFWLSVRREK